MALPSYQKFDINEYPIKDIQNLKIGILRTEWNPEIIDKLVTSCELTLIEQGLSKDRITIHKVPGSYELPLGAKYMLSSNIKPDAIICLGCVIQGETKHDDYINHTIARSLAQLGIVSGIPIMYGVLTTNTAQQAYERAGGAHGNKGEECALGALKMISLKESLSHSSGKISF